ncbi:MATE family efflux transporter [Limnoglobus roseus]|uniref:Multidrug-efflux transporter n=1 Tax=Limnoglobus roseus TaxID=2598579 RepID=A0A5C1AT55_9BACT|nr:MATE family efflux transporter [Limnoglobus roseus]QEL20384.1 MATE family efflux transporter [Limnoglobus roseus]
MTATPSVPLADWRQVLKLALPALAQQYLLLFIQHYDQFLAGPFGESHKAALNTANYIYWLTTCYAVVISAGATALVGRFVGANDRHMANHTTGQAIFLAVVMGLIATAVAWPFLPELLSLLRLKDAAPQIAAAYLSPLVLMVTMQLIETGGIACLIGAGDTRTGLYVLSGVVLVNVPVAYFASRGFGGSELNFVGIAWGTALSHTIGGLAVLTLLIRGRSGLKLTLANLKPDWPLLGRLLRVSIPAAADSLSIAACQLWFLRIVNDLGNEASSAHGIALRWEAFGYQAGGAFGTASMAIISQNLGARRPDQAARGGWMMFAAACGTMSFMGLMFYLFAWPMCRFYSPHDENIAGLGVQALTTVAFAMPALASAIVFTQALRGAGDTRVGVFYSWFGFLVVRIPLAYLLTGREISLGPFGTIAGFDMGLFGAWLAMLVDIWVRGLLFLLRFSSGKWKRVKV